MDPDNWDDLGDEAFQSLLSDLRDGDPGAWRRLYQQLAPAVLGYLRMQRAPNPEDTCSEVFLQIVRDLDTFGGDRSSFRSWAFTVAHHRLVDSRRYDQRRPSYATEHDVLERKAEPILIEPRIVEQLTTEELEDLLEIITPDQRAVILLRVVAGLTMPETAEVLGKGYEACRALQRRGLASLREHLEDEPYPFMGGVTLSHMST